MFWFCGNPSQRLANKAEWKLWGNDKRWSTFNFPFCGAKSSMATAQPWNVPLQLENRLLFCTCVLYCLSLVVPSALVQSVLDLPICPCEIAEWKADSWCYSHVCVSVSVYINEGEIKQLKWLQMCILHVVRLLLRVLYCHLSDTDEYANIWRGHHRSSSLITEVHFCLKRTDIQFLHECVQVI